MSYTGADLLQLQGNIKRDPAGYADEFGMQWRHYQACLALFLLQPNQGSREFQDLITFVAHVKGCYPEVTAGFVGDVTRLLDTHGAVLDPSLRQALVKALILLRNKQQLPAAQLLPVLFRLFRVPDKPLRQLVFRHITADIKAANKKGRNDRLNRAVQNFMYSVLADEHEGTAKRGLAVLTEMWRRHVWRDARTVNVIAVAALHKSPRIMLAALKFFMGQDDPAGDDGGGGGGGGSDSDDGGGKTLVAGPSKEDVYKAFKKGTAASKKRKQKKLARVVASVKRAARREDGGRHESFAALQLLHDPQGFADKLFSRLRSGSERFEARLALVAVLSRAIGVHKLLVLNFYPFLQKYIAPSQRDVTAVLAALVQACHELVPPEALAPVLRQLVDQFVHDRARPEVMTIGLKTVREICTRAPLIMTPDLLQDLVAYRKYRDKEVTSAARALASLFRELAPGMLAKRDRGRGADVDAVPAAYGAARVAAGVEGAELLEAERAAGRVGPDGELLSGDEEGSGSGEEGEEEDEEEDGSDGEEEELGSDAEMGSDAEDIEEGSEAGGDDDVGSSDEEEVSGEDEELGEQLARQAGGMQREGSADGDRLTDNPVKRKRAYIGEADGCSEDDGGGGDSEAGGGEEASDGEDANEGGLSDSASEGYRQRKRRRMGKPQPPVLRAKQAPAADSLATLRRQLAAKVAGAGAAGDTEAAAGGAGGVPADWGRILTQQDFDSIRRLRHRKMVEAAMQKHGLKSASKRARALGIAEEEAEGMLQLKERLSVVNEERVDPSALLGRRHARRDKEERMASVMEGRVGREFGARAKLKKTKTGGKSNREKEKTKRLPQAAHKSQVRKRMSRTKQKSRPKNFKGHVRQ